MNYFIFVSFFSAFLIFSVEPFIVKYALPFFGSSSSTWTVSVLFFQLLLFLGYVYAYKLLSFSPKIQKNIHIGLLLISIALQYLISQAWIAPVLPPSDLPFIGSSFPEWSLTLFLTMSVGIFFFILSTTNTLLQGWYVRSSQKEPFWLYRVSNTGSLVGLFAYPFVIEPYLPIHVQGYLWFSGFLVYSVFLILILSKLKATETREEVEKDVSSYFEKLRWIAYSVIPSFMMLSFTNHITQGISPMPFLWVLPLSLYILSFIFGFQKRIPLLRLLIYVLYIFSLFAIIIRIFSLQGLSVTLLELVSFLFVFFITSLISHHMLYLLKPKRNSVGVFYIMISLGGLIGSFLVALVVPLIFTRFIEVDISLVIPVVFFFILLKDRLSQPIGKFAPGMNQGIPYFIVATSFIYILISIQMSSQKSVVFENRNFYGVVSVKEDAEKRYLNNGSILHGSQYKDESKAHIPTSYYDQKSGVDATFTIMRERRKKLYVGLVGLGVGTISSYCKDEDSFVYYEINPQVIEVAKKYFTYLQMCPETKIVEGDARLSLKNENAEKKYDILIVDAFSDDAIPMHLLTKEAFKIYLGRMVQDGILAIHISNRNVDLAKPIKKMSEELQLDMQIVYKKEKDPNQIDSSPSVWILITKEMNILDFDTYSSFNIIPNEEIPSGELWTDDYSSILRSLKFKQPSYLD